MNCNSPRSAFESRAARPRWRRRLSSYSDRGEPAHREADARDTPPRQIANGMLNDVKSADRVKLIWWDGTGLCLMAKRLEQGGFHWPAIHDGVMRLTSAQLSALLEGLDWRRVHAGRRPQAPQLAG